MGLVDPVIFIPGVTGSELRDEYDVPPTDVWTPVRHRRHARITLHPEHLAYEALEPARVVPGHVFELIYEELIEELRDDLGQTTSEPVPVYPFAYDWRMPLQETQTRLHEFVQEVIERTKLMAHYYLDGYHEFPKVNLVAHSMGGLLVAGYLHDQGIDCVSKVVTLATPFKGSCDAIIELVTGTGRTFMNPSKARKRRAARFCPSAYQLLPSYEGGVEFESGLVADIFEPEAWQQSIVRSMGRSADDWSVTESGEEAASKAFSSMLSSAREHRKIVDNLAFRSVDLGRRWLAIVGLDDPTIVKIRVRMDSDGEPEFAVTEASEENEWNPNNGDDLRTGDGTVPLAGAIPEFIPRNRLVCVTPEHFHLGERFSPPALRFAGFHAQIPTMDVVHRMIVRFLTGDENPHGRLRGMPFPGVEVNEWDPPVS